MGEAAFHAEIQAAHLVALVNWTMIPNMTSIFAALTTHVLPKLPLARGRIYFFDLADPEKRSVEDLRAALDAIAKFQPFGRVTLGLNLKEAQQVAAALGIDHVTEDESSLRNAAAAIRGQLGIDTVVIHPSKSAACANAAGTSWVPGPYTSQPLLTTGAGDHFNAGFTTGQLLGLDPEACLALGVCSSGHYVRTGQSPTLETLETFLANWR
jgi:sugar/nucleoside kinase (ribokinase family)